MKWYDVFSGFYDEALEKLYFDSRKRAVQLLELKNSDKLLDVACGTGANFKHIRDANRKVKIFGTDYSDGMLKKARLNIEQQNWKDIFLFPSDVRDLNKKTIQQYAIVKSGFDKIICALGFSVIPDWEQVLDNLLGLLKPGGRIVIMDVYAEKRDIHTWLVEKIAKADLNRKIWQTLEFKTKNFYYEYLPVKTSTVGGKLFVATGIRR